LGDLGAVFVDLGYQTRVMPHASIDHLTIDDLGPVDEFHSRRRLATQDLTALLGPTAADRVIDIGSGLGGPSRYLAATFGCRVSGTVPVRLMLLDSRQGLIPARRTVTSSMATAD
jgi:trans-aconitate methyltransferase